MNYSFRIISVKKSHYHFIIHKTIKFSMTSEDLIERLFLPKGLDNMMSVEKISKKFPVGIVILSYPS